LALPSEKPECEGKNYAAYVSLAQIYFDQFSGGDSAASARAAQRRSVLHPRATGCGLHYQFGPSVRRAPYAGLICCFAGRLWYGAEKFASGKDRAWPKGGSREACFFVGHSSPEHVASKGAELPMANSPDADTSRSFHVKIYTVMFNTKK
jgi:hypothetical protein